MYKAMAVGGTTVRQNAVIDYTRVCDVCSKYVPLEERLNEARLTPPLRASLPFLWYGANDPSWVVNHLCDTCYLCARLEGHL